MEKLKKFMADQHETKLNYIPRSWDNYQVFIMINKNAHGVCGKFMSGNLMFLQSYQTIKAK